VEEYLRGWSGAAAARKAGYSKKAPYQAAYQVLRNSEVRAAIEARLGEMAMSANEVLARLSDQARGTLSPFLRVTDDGHIEFDFKSPEAAANMYLIKKIHTKRKRLVALGSGTKDKPADEWDHEWVEVELHDAQAALVQLGRYHKLFTEKLEIRERLEVHNLEEILDEVYGKETRRPRARAEAPQASER
jgi:hypothetical protein